MYKKIVKRILDFVMAFFAIIILLPLFLLISIAILIDSKGNVFYVQQRVGKNNKNFKLFKFRTMRAHADKAGLLTIGDHDNRITKIGYLLRKSKLDELPQLLNILFGQMSFVGPRPEVRYYVNYYTPEQMKVLSVLPGLTDWASLMYIDENEILRQAEDHEKAYIETIMPAKLALNFKYINEMSFVCDMKIIFKTLIKIVNLNSR